MARIDLSTRVERDIAAGDLGMARRRLSSALAQGGYDAAIVGRLARIFLAMQDPYQAGRYFVVSMETGAEVDAAIEVFMRRNGNEPTQVVSQLPMSLRLRTLDEYPPGVVERLRRLGLAACIHRPTMTPGALPQHRMSIGEKFTLLFMLFLMGCWVIGIVTVASWIIGWLFPPIGVG